MRQLYSTEARQPGIILNTARSALLNGAGSPVASCVFEEGVPKRRRSLGDASPFARRTASGQRVSRAAEPVLPKPA